MGYSLSMGRLGTRLLRLYLVIATLGLSVSAVALLGAGATPVNSDASVPIPTGAIHIWGIDAHDGDLKQINGTYYLYGTSYGCGFQWGVPSPYCGVRIYTSSDLTTWTPAGFAFDAATSAWQRWCGGSGWPEPGGCFEPRVVAIDGGYTMWLDVPRLNRIAVLHAESPTGPFVFRAWSSVAGGWSEGVYYDAVGEGDLWLAVANHHMDISLQSRTGSYTIRSGSLGQPGIEGPGLFRNGLEWVMTVSYGACGYCFGTQMAYFTSRDPLVSWQFGGVVRSDACGGQPNGVVTLNGQTYEWLDVWNGHQQESQTAAPILLSPLMFNPDGTLQPLACGY
jgi:hypothetical protein